ncbi:pescadillo homolog [Physella acuta]|uniref:pescadillo homolog n=1 Tax=Physella acuta TaxID=109671 RepID=UPI0027DE7D49|nr:pescadillo homolog [Physella acuta]
MGGTKKKKFERGAATAFISRNKALKKLQLNLADFRTLCIFKGIYPVEPLHRKKVNKGSTALKTYYNLKDIQFLSHDQLISKFRETKHYVRKLKKAVAKKNKFAESLLRDNKPVYSLKSVIKERYPSFIDALRDLDDCLNLCCVFATFPHSKKVFVEMVQLCRKRTVEFHHFVIAAKALRKVFVSIKGIYYQADIKGETITWVVSHKRGYEPPHDVDYKIMQTFAEYYCVLLGHINIKLFSDSHLVYPPQLLEQPLQFDTDHCLEVDRVDEHLASLALPIRTTGESVDDDDEDPEVEAMNAINAEDPDFIEKSKLEAKSVLRLQNLFKGLKFFLNREVPRDELTFVIRACSGSVSWDFTIGPGSTFEESDNSITHQIVDRPAVTDQRLDRTYVQPQWVFDCVNARTLLPAKDYFPGIPCPPHLSPFVEEKEGEYVPEDKVKFLKRIRGEELDEDEEESSDEDEEDMGDSSEEEPELTETISGKKRKRVEEDSTESKKVKVSKMAVTAGAVEKVDKHKLLEHQQAEERRLAEMMIPKKHKRLYNKIMTSRKKNQQEAKKLQEKKEILKNQKKNKKKKLV